MQVNNQTVAEEVDMAIARLDRHFKMSRYLRYGQLFLNTGIIKHPWSELYHCTVVSKAREMIRQWLMDNQASYRLNAILDELEQNEREPKKLQNPG